jgi:hypothetical protein
LTIKGPNQYAVVQILLHQLEECLDSRDKKTEKVCSIIIEPCQYASCELLSKYL